MKDRIGIAVEVLEDGYKGNVTEITQIKGQTPIIKKIERELKVEARFDCPCCSSGISIIIDAEL